MAMFPNAQEECELLKTDQNLVYDQKGILKEWQEHVATY
jgi:hypothetical protein